MWGISFSGGGQRGMAHLGVIKGIQKDNIDVSAVSGSSVGAIMAGALAMNIPFEVLYKKVQSLSRKDILDVRLNLFSFIKTYISLSMGRFDFQQTAYWSLLNGKKITKILKEIYGEIKISQLKMPIAITAVDLQSGMDVIFTNRPKNFKEFDKVICDIPLYLAIRSSIAIPLLYKGVKYKSYYLVDGGLTNNIPINLVTVLGVKRVISVEVAKRPPFDKQIEDIIDVGGRLITIAVDNSKYHSNAKMVIKPNLPEMSLGDFSQVNKSIEAGYQSYLEKREKILKNY